MSFATGQRIRLPGEERYVIIDGALPSGDGGWRLHVVDDRTSVRPVSLTPDEASRVELLEEDGTANSAAVLAGL